jgi:hypothetical protein
MNTKLSLFKIRQTAYRLIEVGVYPIVMIIFAILLCWQIYSVFQADNLLKQEIASRDILIAKLDKYRENAKISEQDRLVYGTIIKRQIPQNNNTFDIYALIEAVYETTGIELKIARPTSVEGAAGDQSIILDEGAMPLSASATLTAQSLNEIIDTYQYQYSRFMTLNEIKVTLSKEGQGQFYDVDFIFHVHSMNGEKKDENDTTGSPAQFTSEDKINFDYYINNANIDIYYATQNKTPVDEEYEPSDSLF